MANCNSCGGTTVFISGSIVKCEYCGRLFSTSNGELSAADPEGLYSSAVTMSKSNNEDTLKSAIETFEALGTYKDSSRLANSCRGMIAQFRVEAEERRLAAERQAELERIESEKQAFEEKQKAKIRGIVIAAVSAVAVIVVAINIISNSNKESAYGKALQLYSMGQYEDALEVFNGLGDYSDAATYVSTIDSFLTERETKYEEGVSYYGKGAYSECITSLTDISDYLDSADYIEKSVEAIYQKATEYYDAGQFEKAKDFLKKIPENCSKNMDAELLLADIEETIVEQTNAANYEQAKGYYDSGDYEAAQRLFMSLGNYEDSATYLSAIGTYYYEQANELFKQKEYVQCGDIIQYIDTIEEWNEYAVAVGLKQSASDIYADMIREEAKNICRNEGYASMTAYVNGMKCSVLDESGAERLKEECNIKVISLGELKAYYETGYNRMGEGSVEDTMGNTYAYALSGGAEEYNFYGNKMERSMTWSIDGAYKYFTATVAVEEYWDSSGEGIIRIWGDERLLWSDEAIKATTKPYSIQVDVTGVIDFKIEMYSPSVYDEVILGNPILSE